MNANQVPEGATILVGVAVVSKMLGGRHPVSIWRDCKVGKFPPPLYVGSQRRWRLADVEAWIAAKAQPAEVTP